MSLRRVIVEFGEPRLGSTQIETVVIEQERQTWIETQRVE